MIQRTKLRSWDYLYSQRIDMAVGGIDKQSRKGDWEQLIMCSSLTDRKCALCCVVSLLNLHEEKRINQKSHTDILIGKMVDIHCIYRNACVYLMQAHIYLKFLHNMLSFRYFCYITSIYIHTHTPMLYRYV